MSCCAVLTHDESKVHLSHQLLCSATTLVSMDNYWSSASIISDTVYELLFISAAVTSLPFSPSRPFSDQSAVFSAYEKQAYCMHEWHTQNVAIIRYSAAVPRLIPLLVWGCMRAPPVLLPNPHLPAVVVDSAISHHINGMPSAGQPEDTAVHCAGKS